MASKRRGGFRPPELRGTLGTLLRTTTGVVRDAIERGAREGRARLDGVRANRRRHDALADLGELVLDLIRRGEIDLDELPEARDLVRELDDLDDAAPADEPDRDLPRAATRRRFDDRPARADDRPRRSTPTDPYHDGTVSSGAADRFTKPTTPHRPGNLAPATTRAPTKPIKSMWRPQTDDAPPMPERPTRTMRPDPAHAERADHSDRADRRPAIPRDPDRKGGISFDDDDLADYMHPDDVPPKAPPDDPDDHGA